jgi:hypothetical protein
LYFNDLAKSMGFVDIVEADFDKDRKTICFDIPKDCRPNSYNVTISFIDTTAICGDVSMEVDFDIYYPSSILEAKFGNLITLYDSAYNGGYSFVDNEYRWYKKSGNGNYELVPNEVSSFLYLGDSEFNGEDCYYLELKRKDDGVVMRTCEICPEMETGIDDVVGDEELIKITTIEKGGLILLDKVIRGHINIYSYSGVLISSHDVDANETQIFAPNREGFYVLQILIENKSFVYKIWVR